MRKKMQDITNKQPTELREEIRKLNQEIAKLSVDMKANPPKDSNDLPKKRRQLARMMTVLNSQK
jgi:ribosomal protein L29